MIRVLGLALYGPLAASTRHRLMQYVSPLAERGIELRVESLLGDDYLRRRFANQRPSMLGMAAAIAARLRVLLSQSSFDLTIVHYELIPFLPGWVETRLLRIPYVYDFDDAWHLRYQRMGLRIVRGLLSTKVEAVIRRASAVSAGNSFLYETANALNKSTVLVPTVLDHTLYRVRDWSPAGSTLTVGWIGSPSTAPYLELIREPLERLATEGPVRLLVVGAAAPEYAGVDVEAVPWSERNEKQALAEFDVGVMPLPDDEWARGKCAFKLIQYMAAGVPAVASAVGANKVVLTPDCGVLAGSAGEWLNGFRRIRDSLDLRREMGTSGRRRIVSHYSLESQAPVMAALLTAVAHGADVRQAVAGARGLL